MIYHIWCNYVSGVKSQLFYSDEHSVIWINCPDANLAEINCEISWLSGSHI
jgi:hypothetical protein